MRAPTPLLLLALTIAAAANAELPRQNRAVKLQTRPSSRLHAAPPRSATRHLPPLHLRGGAVADPGWLSILPPVVALGASVALKQVIVALILGVWTGTTVLSRGNPFKSLLTVFDTYLIDALADKEHAGVLLFTLLLGGTIGIVQRAGGGLGLARLLSSFITSAARALYAAYALCCLIFFDDYSSVLIVGSSLRPGNKLKTPSPMPLYSRARLTLTM